MFKQKLNWKKNFFFLSYLQCPLILGFNCILSGLWLLSLIRSRSFRSWFRHIFVAFSENFKQKLNWKKNLLFFFLILFAMSFDPGIQLYFIYDYFLWFVLVAIFRSSDTPQQCVTNYKRNLSKACYTRSDTMKPK